MTEDQHFDDVLARSRALVEAIKRAKSEFQAELESICAHDAVARRVISNPNPAEQQLAERVKANIQGLMADNNPPAFSEGSTSAPQKKRRLRLMV